LTPEREPIGIAGAGRIAQALGRLLREHGQPVVAVASRDPSHAKAAGVFIGGSVEVVSYLGLPERASRILIAVSDSAIHQVASILAGAGMSRGVALHTCGTIGPEGLEPLARVGVSCGTLHPLQTVATAEQGLEALPGAAFAIDGDSEARLWAEEIAGLLNGLPLRIPAGRRPYYHAAAVMASNYVVGLIDAAVILMGTAGVEEEEALRAIGPLAQATVKNALALGPVKALTGPIERGDTETVAAHLKALTEAPTSVRDLYRAAGLHVVELARRRGLAEADARRLEALLRKSEQEDV
jgi:predicted short-subunit dehydrogenase-like oxidoreductase (DUF2520 family)